MGQRQALVQWSLGELVIVLTTGTIVIGSMWAPQVFLWLVLIFFMLLVFSMVAISRVGRHHWRTFATGFCCFTIGYLAALLLVENPNLSTFPTIGQLPTTNLMFQCQEILTHTRYIKDGKVIPASRELKIDTYGNVIDSDGNSLGSTMAVGPLIPGVMGTPNAGIQIVRNPDPIAYITLGHVFWALLLGYLGGKFAVGFQRFQNNQETALQPSE